MCKVIEEAAIKVEQSDDKKFNNKTPRRTLITAVEEIVKGVM